MIIYPYFTINSFKYLFFFFFFHNEVFFSQWKVKIFFTMKLPTTTWNSDSSDSANARLHTWLLEVSENEFCSGTGGRWWFYILFPVQVHGNIPARPVALAQALSIVHLWRVWSLYPLYYLCICCVYWSHWNVRCWHLYIRNMIKCASNQRSGKFSQEVLKVLIFLY